MENDTIQFPRSMRNPGHLRLALILCLVFNALIFLWNGAHAFSVVLDLPCVDVPVRLVFDIIILLGLILSNVWHYAITHCQNCRRKFDRDDLKKTDPAQLKCPRCGTPYWNN